MKFSFVLPLCILSASAFSPPCPAFRKNDSSLNVVSRRDALARMPAAAAFLATPAFAAPKAEAKNPSKADTKKNSKADEMPPSKDVVTVPYFGSVTGVFEDPKHPKGYRIIVAKQGALSGTMQLRDGSDEKLFFIPIKIKTDTKKGISLGIDFSEKGGPKDVIGMVSQAENGGPIRITFPDGNVWKKETGIEGVYSDPNHPTGYQVIRKGSGSTVTVESKDDGKKSTEPVIFKASTKADKKNGMTISFPFPTKDPKKPNTQVASVKDGFIIFADGSKWTKL
mmetsp:Transcript_7537/g.15637  ORF Transcript_7537/g.15637 Transcript_7537/m.15637 type:complete len:281 (+) Transcript_7537:61-903(+)|eukprot:CAMPEP_0194323822 /NCGR_PEP_ID=MMETSP0171-20130528/25983_1 /TAXON_ID=218684 /ORGANISM="Corethron pennatum, Strain L29A3" /LENGTH=280 /DNA_ID=CAMNT_0039082555 /DNA_START=58 /DNA_END=900 /DNA_ORIENTATION=-